MYEYIYKFKDLDDKIKEILFHFNSVSMNLHYIYSYISLKDKLGKLCPLEEYIKYMKSIDEYSLKRLSSKELDKMINNYNNNLILTEKLYYEFNITEDEYDGVLLGKIKIK